MYTLLQQRRENDVTPLQAHDSDSDTSDSSTMSVDSSPAACGAGVGLVGSARRSTMQHQLMALLYQHFPSVQTDNTTIKQELAREEEFQRIRDAQEDEERARRAEPPHARRSYSAARARRLSMQQLQAQAAAANTQPHNQTNIQQQQQQQQVVSHESQPSDHARSASFDAGSSVSSAPHPPASSITSLSTALVSTLQAQQSLLSTLDSELDAAEQAEKYYSKAEHHYTRRAIRNYELIEPLNGAAPPAARTQAPVDTVDLLVGLNEWFSARALVSSDDDFNLLSKHEEMVEQKEAIRSDAQKALEGIISSLSIPPSTRMELLNKLQITTLQSWENYQENMRTAKKHLYQTRRYLIKTIHDHDDEVAKLTATITQQQDELDKRHELEDKLKAAKNREEDMQCELKEAYRKNDILNEEVDDLHQREQSHLYEISRLEKQLNSQTEHVRHSSHEIAELTLHLSDHARLKGQVSSLQHQVHKLQKSARLKEAQLDTINQMFKLRRDFMQNIRQEEEEQRKREEERERKKEEIKQEILKQHEMINSTFLTETLVDSLTDPVTSPKSHLSLLSQHIAQNKKLFQLLVIYPHNVQKRRDLMQELSSWISHAESVLDRGNQFDQPIAPISNQLLKLQIQFEMDQRERRERGEISDSDLDEEKENEKELEDEVITDEPITAGDVNVGESPPDSQVDVKQPDGIDELDDSPDEYPDGDAALGSPGMFDISTQTTPPVLSAATSIDRLSLPTDSQRNSKRELKHNTKRKKRTSPHSHSPSRSISRSHSQSRSLSPSSSRSTPPPSYMSPLRSKKNKMTLKREKHAKQLSRKLEREKKKRKDLAPQVDSVIKSHSSIYSPRAPSPTHKKASNNTGVEASSSYQSPRKPPAINTSTANAPSSFTFTSPVVQAPVSPKAHHLVLSPRSLAQLNAKNNSENMMEEAAALAQTKAQQELTRTLTSSSAPPLSVWPSKQFFQLSFKDAENIELFKKEVEKSAAALFEQWKLKYAVREIQTCDKGVQVPVQPVGESDMSFIEQFLEIPSLYPHAQSPHGDKPTQRSVAFQVGVPLSFYNVEFQRWYIDQVIANMGKELREKKQREWKDEQERDKQRDNDNLPSEVDKKEIDDVDSSVQVELRRHEDGVDLRPAIEVSPFHCLLSHLGADKFESAESQATRLANIIQPFSREEQHIHHAEKKEKRPKRKEKLTTSHLSSDSPSSLPQLFSPHASPSTSSSLSSSVAPSVTVPSVSAPVAADSPSVHTASSATPAQHISNENTPQQLSESEHDTSSEEEDINTFMAKLKQQKTVSTMMHKIAMQDMLRRKQNELKEREIQKIVDLVKQIDEHHRKHTADHSSSSGSGAPGVSSHTQTPPVPSWTLPYFPISSSLSPPLSLSSPPLDHYEPLVSEPPTIGKIIYPRGARMNVHTTHMQLNTNATDTTSNVDEQSAQSDWLINVRQRLVLHYSALLKRRKKILRNMLGPRRVHLLDSKLTHHHNPSYAATFHSFHPTHHAHTANHHHSQHESRAHDFHRYVPMVQDAYDKLELINEMLKHQIVEEHEVHEAQCQAPSHVVKSASPPTPFLPTIASATSPPDEAAPPALSFTQFIEPTPPKLPLTGEQLLREYMQSKSQRAPEHTGILRGSLNSSSSVASSSMSAAAPLQPHPPSARHRPASSLKDARLNKRPQSAHFNHHIHSNK